MIEITPSNVLSSAVCVFTLSLLTAHLLSTYPLSKLGKRPIGKGLYTYLYSQLFSSYTGCWGYDSSLGSFAPFWRLMFHICTIMVFYAVVLYMNMSSSNSNVQNLKVGLRVTLVYTLAFFFYGKFSKGVSDPGGPREHKIPRMPKWNNVQVSIPKNSQKWRCAVAQDSHRVTLKRFNLDPKSHGEDGINSGDIGMHGEPFGRQMWTTEPNPIDWSHVSEEQRELIKDMAKAGRQDFNPSFNPNSSDVLFREQMITNYVANGGELPDVKKGCKNVKDAMKKAVHFYSMIQTEDRHWAGDYGGPHFLMPGLIIAWYVMGKPSLMLNEEQCALMAHYLKVHQQSDGGWGSHIESPSTMFGTTLCYVSLRLLGVDKNDEHMKRGRAFIQRQGGVLMTSSWAKFWLCVLGCMEWEGHDSVPPEMWLLPNWFPFHPGRLWCHCRMVYLPMGYLYGSRFIYDKAETDDVVLSLRNNFIVNHMNQFVGQILAISSHRWIIILQFLL